MSLSSDESKPFVSGLFLKVGRALIVSARQVSGAGLGDKTLLLSSANDRVIALWDLERTRDGVPRRLSSDKSAHSGGIFSMDVRGLDVRTLVAFYIRDPGTTISTKYIRRICYAK